MSKHLVNHKTKIVCTIGPATESVSMIKKLLRAGMNIARLNFSHGEFSYHKELIENIRSASTKVGLPVTIMADLPGPKMRIGKLESDPIFLEKGQLFVLTTRDVIGSEKEVSITVADLPKIVKAGNKIFLNDGLIQLEVQRATDTDIFCTVISGGELRSKKGLNMPGIELGNGAFTKRDEKCLRFALENGVEAISQSFVSSASDIEAIRNVAKAIGKRVFVIAKIERAICLEHLDEIIDAADGIMIARGDLGVEIPIEKIAIVQKQISQKALFYGKPVITATQMLMSMTKNKRPTRAEATDVANAILDGTDAVMLSEESATGSYPVEAVEMLSKIAEETEPYIDSDALSKRIFFDEKHGKYENLMELMAGGLKLISGRLATAFILCPTESGNTARAVSRYRIPAWIFGVSNDKRTCSELMFSYGVWPVFLKKKPTNWSKVVQDIVKKYEIKGNYALMIEGPSSVHPYLDHRLEILKLESN